MKILLSILFSLFSASAILGCTCANTKNITDEEHSKRLKQVKAIFYGEVISHGERRFVGNKYPSTPNTISTHLPIKFRVLRAWKGIDSEEVIVETEVSSSCGYVAEVGSKIMVYAYEDKKLNTPFEISQCSIEHFDDEKMKREYGEGKVFDNPKVSPIQLSENNESFWSNIWKTFTSLFS
jgi:hypothetical protein